MDEHIKPKFFVATHIAQKTCSKRGIWIILIFEKFHNFQEICTKCGHWLTCHSEKKT
jgi:hypothetical protein